MTTWRGGCSSPSIRWAALALAVGMTLGAIGCWLGGVPWLGVLLAVLGVLAFVAALGLTSIAVTVDAAGLTIQYGPWRRPVRTLPWDQVLAVQALDVVPMQWGGWGYRWVPWRHATAVVLRAGPGVRFDRVDGRTFVVTVDDAEGCAGAAQQYLAAAGA